MLVKHDEGNLRRGSRGLLDCGYMQHPVGVIAVGDGNIQATLGVVIGIWSGNEPKFESSHVSCPSCCYSKSSADSGQSVKQCAVKRMVFFRYKGRPRTARQTSLLDMRVSMMPPSLAEGRVRVPSGGSS